MMSPSNTQARKFTLPGWPADVNRSRGGRSPMLGEKNTAIYADAGLTGRDMETQGKDII